MTTTCRTLTTVLAAGVLALPACSAPSQEDATDTASGGASSQRFPDVVEASLEPEDGGTFAVEVTISSPYDTPDRYADGWRVSDASGNELGTHELTHDHAEEQPFTRSQTGLQVPGSVSEVVVEGRDSENGYGGETVTVEVPR